MKDKKAKETQLMKKKITFWIYKWHLRDYRRESDFDYIRLPEGYRITKCRKTQQSAYLTKLRKTTEREIDFC